MIPAQEAWLICNRLYDRWNAGSVWRICRLLSGSTEFADTVYEEVYGSVRSLHRHRRLVGDRAEWVELVLITVDDAKSGCRPIPVRFCYGPDNTHEFKEVRENFDLNKGADRLVYLLVCDDLGVPLVNQLILAAM